MGSGFIRPDAGLVSKIQRLTDAGVEVAVLSHSFKQGEGQAMEKLEKLGLKGVIPERNIDVYKRQEDQHAVRNLRPVRLSP